MPDEVCLDRALNHKCSACRSSDIQSRQGAFMSDHDNRAPSTRTTSLTKPATVRSLTAKVGSLSAAKVVRASSSWDLLTSLIQRA